ncbi:helix-turn-helix domain-containing protein [Streptomyces sp. SID9124]|uniref:tetratricopeptide repeat protein n=1 Tax=Streptomyces sp. SID9124 TaxID=2706108 RepID=UPI0013E0DD1D|nr:tetratricopeptide repeat protein [Streptomyces sp. SID9124]
MGETAAFGASLRRRRATAGMSLAELARLVHYSKGHLSKVERGLALPGADLVRLCAEVLGEEPEAEDQLAHPLRPAYALPEAGRHFVGRDKETELVESLILSPVPRDRSRPAVCAITGMAGVGKTALAVRIARGAGSRFPDGCLYIDLHGYSRNVLAVTAADALDRLLRMLGMPAESIPRHVEDRAAVYRGALAGRRALVVLDNAVDSRHVRPLLPHEAGCTVLVTSRSSLPALDEAHHVPLGPLSAPDAAELFSRVAGTADETGADGPAAGVREVVDLCGRLPLAVRIAATRCRPNGARTVEDFAHRLADQRWGLAELDDGERSVVAPFTVSFDALGEAAQRMFALLGLLPGVECEAPVAAVLAGWDLPAADRALDQLADAHLLIRTRPGRFRLHDLLRAFARQIADRTLAPEVHRAVTGRLAGHYIAAADSMGRVLAPHRYRLGVADGVEQSAVPMPRAGGHDEALAWFTAEQDTVAALVHETARLGLDSECWRLAYVLRDFYFLSKRWDAWIAGHRVALEAAHRVDDPGAEAVTANNLGLALIETGDLDGAAAHYERAHLLYSRTGDEHGAANSVANHAWVHFYRGEHAAALAELVTALAYYRRAGARRNVGITLRGIGLAELELCRFEDAVSHLESALATLESLGLQLDTAMALNCLGEAYLRSGRTEEGRDRLERAVAVSRLCGSRHEEARARYHLALAAGTAAE